MDILYSQLPTNSSNGSGGQPLPAIMSPDQAARDRVSWIALQARQIFGSYRRDDFADPETFLRQLGMVLERYSDEIISAVTSPLTGVQRKCKQPPSLADVVNACDEESARIERLKRLNSMRFEAHTDPRPKHHRANVFVHSNAPQYARMLARAENGADPNDFCYDATRPGIWVPIGWLTEQGPAARRGFKQFTKEDLEKIYKRHDEAKRAASNPPIAAEINQRK